MKRNFSLIELMTIVGLLVVIAALITPVIAQAQKQSNATVCMANMKDAGMSFSSYAKDNNDMFPQTRSAILEKTDGAYRVWVYTLIKGDYLKLENVLCPEGLNQSTDPWTQGGLKNMRAAAAAKRNSGSYVYVHYGYNAKGLGAGEAGNEMRHKVSEVGPSVIVLADSVDMNNYNIKRYAGSYIIEPKVAKSISLINPIHEQHANVLWSDGHVSTEDGGATPADVYTKPVFADKAHWFPASPANR